MSNPSSHLPGGNSTADYKLTEIVNTDTLKIIMPGEPTGEMPQPQNNNAPKQEKSDSLSSEVNFTEHEVKAKEQQAGLEFFDLTGGKEIQMLCPNESFVPIDVFLSTQRFQIVKANHPQFNEGVNFILIDPQTFNPNNPTTGYKGLWEGQEVSFGRNHHPDRFQYLPDVAGEHLSIRVEGNRITVKDLNSTKKSRVILAKYPPSDPSKDKLSEESILPIGRDVIKEVYAEIFSNPDEVLGLAVKTLDRIAVKNNLLFNILLTHEKASKSSFSEEADFIHGATVAYLTLEKAAQMKGQELPEISGDIISSYLESELRHMRIGSKDMKVDNPIGEKPKEISPEDSLQKISMQDPEFGKLIDKSAKHNEFPHKFSDGALMTYVLIQNALHAEELAKKLKF